jgi:hypothetical protein
MTRSWLLLWMCCAASLVGCSGRAGDAVVLADASAPEAQGSEAQADEVTVAEAAATADGGDDAAPPDVFVVETEPDVPEGDASVAPDAATNAPDAPADAARGCYLQGYVYCPVGTWCPLGTCPDGITPYGCLCNPDGTTSCQLDCPN